MKKNSHYLFQFDSFVKEALESEKYHDSIVNYGKAYESLEDTALEDTTFYKDYLSKFDISGFEIKSPEDLEDDFDYELLVRLIVSSFSSDYVLSLDETWKDNPDVSTEPLTNVSVFVKTDSGNQNKDLQELWSFQVLRLFEIYLIEQIDLAILYAEEKEDEEDEEDETANGVAEARQLRLRKYEARKKQLLKGAGWIRSINDI